MTGRAPDSGSSGPLSERDLLGRLGLGPGASDDEIESAHDEIVDFLATAPGSLGAWAELQLGEVDEAYAQLNGAPASASAPLAVPATMGPATARPREAAMDSDFVGDGFDGGFDGDGSTGWGSPVRPAATLTRGEHRTGRTARRASEVERRGARDRARPSGGAIVIGRDALRKAAVVVAGLVLIGGIVGGVYAFGQPSVPAINGTPAPGASGGLDTAAVSAAMQKLAANPNDVATLQDLADLYYAAEDYTTAKSWLQRILDIDPKNTAALLGYGAAAFNLDDLATAEAKWRAVLAIDANNIEAHYDLGFMYFSQSPPNLDGVKTEWNAVLALNPSDTIKSYVQAHLASLEKLESGQPGGSPAPSGAPATSPTPAISPAPAAASPSAS
jgi:cytochrome c-type biogenesis protein CcmH/NrfG